MRKIKFIIPLLILFLTIGFAAVNFSLSINGDTEITGNLDNFNVYFSRALVNGETNNSIVSSKTQLDFSGIIDKVGNTYTIEYDVTNASTLFDAEVIVKCSPSSEYLLVQNTFDTSNLSALETRTGTLLLRKLKTISNDSSIYKTITCEIIATPIERESEVTGSIAAPLNPVLIGREIAIGEEKFNVISSTEDTVTMLAKYNISSSFTQADYQVYSTFSKSSGWEYTPGPKEIDIQEWESNSKEILNGYLSYIQGIIGDYSISANIITLDELKKLGCAIPVDYGFDSNFSHTCANSPYAQWLVNNMFMWTRSADSNDSDKVWYVGPSGSLYTLVYTEGLGVRPTITISRELYTKLLSSSSITYKVGREISIGDEKFNVISDNGLTVTMLAKYNLGTDYRQSEIDNNVTFSDTSGWEYTPGPKEINIQEWSTNPKIYVNEYLMYLREETNTDNISIDLISNQQLKKLGCTISENYSWNGKTNCNDSIHKKWLITSQQIWTKSASSGGEAIWVLLSSNSLDTNKCNHNKNGVRPTITIDKETLNYLESLGSYEIGEEISIENEKFNVISQTATTVTMLAQYNLGADFKQSETAHYVIFSDTTGWESTPGPKEIDIYEWSTNPKNYINGYISYLEHKTGDTNIKGDLITLTELGELGCKISADYSLQGTTENCGVSPHSSWIINGQWWWTKSAVTGESIYIWRVYEDGGLYRYNYDKTYGVRPTITISKETLKYLASQKKYEIGQEVSIGTEKFNVISDNGTTISMLAQYNLGTNYRQSTTINEVDFSNTYGWEFQPAPQEVDVQIWSTNPKIYINEYVSFLQEKTKDKSLTGNLITLKELEKLGCSIPINYEYSSDYESNNCIDSPYKSWLLSANLKWWTRSARSDTPYNFWTVFRNTHISNDIYSGKYSIRPVITISKSAL